MGFAKKRLVQTKASKPHRQIAQKLSLFLHKFPEVRMKRRLIDK